MTTTRQQKVARLIQKEMADYFQKNSREFGKGVLISATVVRITPDLGLAKVYLSIFPSDHAKDIMETIEINTKTIRHELAQKVRHQLRIVPELAFYLDDSLDYADRINQLLK